ncbi:hypothetical protein DKX38_014635 [Salix brachista]|uniref:Subtilisin-like protease fibronectin type-III domain-containing protein n=1 Tax=Salix brachista TaxID=2182728 RepID=A0A5N5LHY8_9ROSI|nr:hypothetical protein DKX38_014635 [Salix brachista]
MAEALIDDPRKKAVAAQLGGGVAMILIDPIVKEICFQFVVPSTLIGQEEAQQLQAYMQAQKNPTARIAPTVTVLNSKPAPKVTVFSSQGPNIKTPDTIKVNAIHPFKYIHSIICSNLEILQTFWNLAAIKSAIMTTVMANTRKRIGRDPNDTKATPFDYGSGHKNPLAGLNAGLVYDFNCNDVISFLCSTAGVQVTVTPATLKFKRQPLKTSDGNFVFGALTWVMVFTGSGVRLCSTADSFRTF